MTTDDTPSTMPRWVRKLLIPAAGGGLVGFVAAAGTLRLIDSSLVDGLDKSATIAALVGMLYLLIGLMIMVGIASPQMGAKFLNVEDADELREQKQVLSVSGWAMMLWGAALMVLALAAPGGPVPQAAALAVGLAGLVIGTLLSVKAYRASDELMLMVNLEGGALSYGLSFLIIGGWAMAAHLGYCSAPQPLDLLSLFYALALLASFIAVGRRGMLTTR